LGDLGDLGPAKDKDKDKDKDRRRMSDSSSPSIASCAASNEASVEASYAARDRRYVWHPFTQMAHFQPLVITEAEGAYLIAEDGRRYLDGVSSLWANVHGHRRPEIDRAVSAQLGRLAHSTLLGLSHPPSIELAEQLVGLAPPGLAHVFYSDSGSTAVEVALKMAYQFHQAPPAAAGPSPTAASAGAPRPPTRHRFLALTDAYHGDTLGAVSVGGIDLFHKIFSPLLFHTLRTAPTLAGLEAAFAAHGHELCAFVVEPLIQGAAGMLLQPPGFLARARQLCDEHGVLLIADEVATGFGRTGTLFACEQEGVSPDFLCLAKGLTGGYLPLAATLTTEAVYARFLGPRAAQRAFFHGHTYTGNPLACAAALANLEIFAREQTLQQLPAKIALLTRLLAEQLGGHRHVRQIRQRGLMVGIELGETPTRSYPAELLVGAQVCERVRDYGVILRPLGDVVVLMPPLCILAEELVTLVQATRRAVDEVSAAVAAGPGAAPGPALGPATAEPPRPAAVRL
jgi:adenosylmethionine-8-amino-7-oxononanoate aminotransferase